MFDPLVVKVNNNTHRTELQIRLEAFLTSSVAYNRVHIQVKVVVYYL